MPHQSLPERLRRRFQVDTVDEMWRKMLTEGNVRTKRWRHLYGRLPANPRCVQCHRPFAGVGGAFLRLTQKVRRSNKNPRFCADCHWLATQFPGGAEIELTMLFVDVRGSTRIAERMDALEFSRLMNRFYEAAISVLVQADAFIDKLVGDEVTALFIPGYAGEEHARKAVAAGQALLRATGHGQPGGPWIPVGVGIHTGAAWVGSIAGASGVNSDFTALGDSVNIAARLASLAAEGEVLVSEAAAREAGIRTAGLERRELKLKGKSAAVAVRVLPSFS
jgi:adenylate cyclase